MNPRGRGGVAAGHTKIQQQDARQEVMHNERLNPRVLALEDSHPAKKFLSAFIECRGNCVGLELDPDEPIDQEWESATDGRVWTFSGFAYTFLSLDLALDDFHQSVPPPTESTATWPWDLPRLRSLMHECARSARESGNNEIVELTDEVLRMFELWDEYLSFRKDLISHGQS
jgi:hypothetical protein